MKLAFVAKDPERNLYYCNTEDDSIYRVKDELGTITILWATMETMNLWYFVPYIQPLLNASKAGFLFEPAPKPMLLFTWMGPVTALLAVILLIWRYREINSSITEKNKVEATVKDLTQMYQHGAIYRYALKVLVQLSALFYTAFIAVAIMGKGYVFILALASFLTTRVLDYIITVKPLYRKRYEKHLKRMEAEPSQSDSTDQ